MKEINGTVTLAYVEEDNKQRVIFRVIPLCTREGSVFRGGAEDFPDEGSLRIVPDKREQSTFKDRMRGIGGLCAVYLLSDGKELVKVRQNRNYAPEQGEKNKLAIYSDVICEFSEDGCFEVLEPGADYESALTEKILLLKDKMLYGPVLRAQAATADIAALHPFGNDSFLLHSVETPSLGKHQVYWNPEAVLNWRQRRNALRRKERAGDERAEKPGEPSAAPQAAAPEVKPALPELKPEAPQKQAAAEPAPRKAAPAKPAEKAKEKPRRENAPKAREEAVPVAVKAEPAPAPMPEAVKTAEPEAESNLPIGQKLDILDAGLSFDQHISRLEQPLSMSANRLTAEAEAPQEEPDEPAPHFSGTPLVPVAKPITRSASKPESVHHVVEQQLLRRGEKDADSSEPRLMDNPIDSLHTCLDFVWQSADMRAQAMDMLSQNESFMYDMLQLFRRRGLNTQATAAAQEQLAEIEAERLSLLMQLESAKANEKKYREDALASLSQKLRAESEKLKNEVGALEGSKQKLTQALEVLSTSTADQVREYMSQNLQCLSGAGEDRLLISPVAGRHYTRRELSEKLRIHMNESGYSVTEDDITNLLVYFSVSDALCLLAPSEADAARFARVVLESLGLQSVSGSVMPNAYVEVVSLLPENGQRTPTVTVQALGTESMSIYGHKTLFLADRKMLGDLGFGLPSAYPVLFVPPLMKRATATSDTWKSTEPAALSSFTEISADAHPMQEEAVKWFDDLKLRLEQSQVTLPAPIFMDIRRFMEVATRKVRGGFLAAADSAVCHWIVPTLLLRSFDPQQLGPVFAGLPKTLERLHIQ